MSLRIEQDRFFLDTCRTTGTDTQTDKEQGACEEAVEKIFKTFLQQRSSFGLK